MSYHMEDPEQKTEFFNEIAKMLLEFTEELEESQKIRDAIEERRQEE